MQVGRRLDKAETKSTVNATQYLEDNDGEVATRERYDYDPYGELDSDPTDPEAAANPFRFEGFYFDSGVRSYDMQARAYRPDVGRFLQHRCMEAQPTLTARPQIELAPARFLHK
jgi:RHS repeat-associated protein